MKAKMFLFGLVGLLFTACQSQVKDNVLTKEEMAQGWQLLFDGESMDQWRNFNSETLTGWAIEDGCMVALGLGGDYAHDIITKDQFENFELFLEWKLTAKANSGIFYLAREQEGVKAIYEIAPEYQLIDDEGWPGGLEEWQKTGANYAMHTPDPALKQLNPVGTFNSTLIRVEQGHVEHWLNGVMILEYDLWDDNWLALRNSEKWQHFPHYGTASEGHIGLQDHGNKIYFKNIKIRSLNP